MLFVYHCHLLLLLLLYNDGGSCYRNTFTIQRSTYRYLTAFNRFIDSIDLLDYNVPKSTWIDVCHYTDRGCRAKTIVHVRRVRLDAPWTCVTENARAPHFVVALTNNNKIFILFQPKN
jgi:hypothetical protein